MIVPDNADSQSADDDHEDRRNAHMEAYSEEDRTLVKGGNLARLLGWEVT